MHSMSEEHTGNLGGDRSFEERVFARFDAIDARFDAIDGWRDSVDKWRGSIDGWRDSVDKWRGSIDGWRDSVDKWRGSIDGWRDSVDKWRGSIDGWRDSIDVWRSATDSRFDRIEKRLTNLEVTSEKRALETKPIWERALSEILELKSVVGDLTRRMEIFHRDLVKIRADQVLFDERLEKIESKRS
jgi:hypothetical protein